LILLLLAAVSLFPTSDAESWFTMLQGKYNLGCSADRLLSGAADTGVIIDGLPLLSTGTVPDLPWTSAHTTDPVYSGIWGGGRWNTTVESRAFQDSLSVSRIGLIQNTGNRSRYAFELDRPLPWQASGSFELLRDDSVTMYSSLMKKGPFQFRAMSWEGQRYGWGSWLGWSRGSWYARTGFSRLSVGDRRPELLAGARSVFSTITLELGAAAALVDSMIKGKGVAGISGTTGSITASVFGEYNEEGEGFWGGVAIPAGRFELSAGLSRPAGGEFFQTVAIRHSAFNIVGRFSGETAIAADISAGEGFIRGKGAACWNFSHDSLSTSSWLLLGFDWYKGRVEAGPRVTAGLNSSGQWNEVLDAVLGFTLAPFSISCGIEDMTNEAERSWSFGLTWAFRDKPPMLQEGDTGGERSRN
jgi:hypothetical protein